MALQGRGKELMEKLGEWAEMLESGDPEETQPSEVSAMGPCRCPDVLQMSPSGRILILSAH